MIADRHMFIDVMDKRDEWEAYARGFKVAYKSRHKMQKTFAKIIDDWEIL